MALWLEIVLAVLLVVGAGFALLGSIGLAKFRDFYMRLHGPTKATTLGLGAMLLASTIFFSVSRGLANLHEVLISIFLFITAPVSAHLLAKTALHKSFAYEGGSEDPLENAMNAHTDQAQAATQLSEAGEQDEEEDGEPA